MTKCFDRFSPNTKERLQALLATTTADPQDIIESLMSATVDNVSTAQTIFTSAKKIMKKMFDNDSMPKQNTDDPLDQQAFHFFPPGRKGGQHRSVDRVNDRTFNLANASRKALARAVRRLIDSLGKAGDYDQRRLTLSEFFFHDETRPYISGVFGAYFSKENAAGRVILKGARAISDKIAQAKNKGKSSNIC